MIQQTTRAVGRADLGEAVHEYNLTGEGFIASEILPVRPVKKKAATLSVITRENLKRADAKHANGAGYNRVNLTAEDLAYACVEYGLEGPLTDDDRENFASDFDAELETVADVENKLLTEREIRVAALVFNTTTWTGASLYTNNSGSPWDTITTKIITQIAAAKEKVRLSTGTKANALIIGEAAMQNLLINTEIIGRFPGATIVTEAMLRSQIASLFGLEDLIVGGKAYDSAKEGQDFVAGDIWADDYAMVAKISKGSLNDPGLGKTVLWEPLTSEIATVEEYREEQTKSDIYRVSHYLDEKIFDPYFAHLMKIDA